MNWYKRAQHSSKDFDWEKIRLELRIELNREPTSGEIQQRSYQKFWQSTEIPEQKQMELFK